MWQMLLTNSATSAVFRETLFEKSATKTAESAKMIFKRRRMGEGAEKGREA